MRTQRVRRSAGSRASAKPSARPRFGLQPKGKRLAEAGGIALLLGLGSASTLSGGSLGAAIAAAQAQIDVLGSRSPGMRTEASLSKGKPHASARALPGARDARNSAAVPGAAVPGPLAALLPPPGGVAGPVAGGPIPVDTPGAAFLPGALPGSGFLPGGGGVFAGGPGAFLPPFGGIGGGGGGGGGGVVVLPPGPPGTGPTEETPPIVIVTPPTPTAPIPEPGRWALMILGFGLVGATLRRRLPSLSCSSRAQA